MVAETVEKSIGAEETFARDVDDSEVVLRELLRLSEQVAARLRAADCVGRTVVLKIRFADFTTITRSRTLREHTDVGQVVYATARDLYAALGLDRARLRLVGVRVEGLVDAASGHRQLAFGERPQGWREAEQAVDRAAAGSGRAPSAPPPSSAAAPGPSTTARNPGDPPGRPGVTRITSRPQASGRRSGNTQESRNLLDDDAPAGWAARPRCPTVVASSWGAGRSSVRALGFARADPDLFWSSTHCAPGGGRRAALRERAAPARTDGACALRRGPEVRLGHARCGSTPRHWAAAGHRRRRHRCRSRPARGRVCSRQKFSLSVVGFVFMLAGTAYAVSAQRRHGPTGVVGASGKVRPPARGRPASPRILHAAPRRALGPSPRPALN